jgi:hypothetical protein
LLEYNTLKEKKGLLKNSKEAKSMANENEQENFRLVCPHNERIYYDAPLSRMPDGRMNDYYDCLGELDLAQKIARQQSGEISAKLGSDLARTAMMYFGNGITYGQCLGQALGLLVAIIGWGEIKPKWRENVISSSPFKSITDPSGKAVKRLNVGWPQLDKLEKYNITQLIIADDVTATGSSLLSAENLVEKISQKLARSITVAGFVVAAKEGEDVDPQLDQRLLASPVFHIPIL